MSVLTVAALKALWIDGFIPDQDDYVDLFDTIEALGLADAVTAFNGLTRTGDQIGIGGTVGQETLLNVGAFKFLIGTIVNGEGGNEVVSGLSMDASQGTVRMINASGTHVTVSPLGGVSIASPDTGNSIVIPNSGNSTQGVVINGQKLALTTRDNIIELGGTNTGRYNLDLSNGNNIAKVIQMPAQGGTLALLSDIVGGSSLYSADGSIPANTDREISLIGNASLNITGENNTSFFIDDNDFELSATAVSIESPSWAMNAVNGGGSVNSGDNSVLEIIGIDGITLRFGSGGSPEATVIGKYLRAKDTGGGLEYGYASDELVQSNSTQTSISLNETDYLGKFDVYTPSGGTNGNFTMLTDALTPNWAIGGKAKILFRGTGALTFTPFNGSVTILQPSGQTFGENDVATVVKVAADTWSITKGA